MKIISRHVSNRLRLAGFCGMVAVLYQGSFGALHVITFGGATPFSYVPSSLQVMVGDTVRWSGNFSSHPLSSTDIPVGAQAWRVNSGSVFNYVVKAAGSYDYQCDFHIPQGMIGSFSASAAATVAQVVSPAWNRTGVLVTVVRAEGRPAVRVSGGDAVMVEIFSGSGRTQELQATGRFLGSHSVWSLPPTIRAGQYILRVRFEERARKPAIFRIVW